MLPADVLRQVRRLHLRARRAVQTVLGGEYRSAFKGAGLAERTGSGTRRDPFRFALPGRRQRALPDLPPL